MVVVVVVVVGGCGVVEVAEASGVAAAAVRGHLTAAVVGGWAVVGAARAAAAATAAATVFEDMLVAPCLWARIASIRDQPAATAERACTYGTGVIPVRPVRHAGSLRLRLPSFGGCRAVRRHGSCSSMAINQSGTCKRGQERKPASRQPSVLGAVTRGALHALYARVRTRRLGGRGEDRELL